MKCIKFPDKDCELLTCHTKRKCLWDESPQHPEQGDAIEALKLCQPFMEDLQFENHNEPAAGITYDYNLEKAIRALYKCLGIETFPPSQPAGEQPPAVEGELYRWVRASERLPEKRGRENSVIIRGCDMPPDGFGHAIKGSFVSVGFVNFDPELPRFYFEYGHDSYLSNETIEWLEKLPSQPPPPLPVEQDSELRRLYEWIMDDNRKAAQTFFTAGWLRNCAREIEWRIKK